MLTKKIRKHLGRLRKLIRRIKNNQNDDYGYATADDHQSLRQINRPNDGAGDYIEFVPRKEISECKEISEESKEMRKISDDSLSLLADLPDVPLLKIFSYLSGAQILRLNLVCKRWRWLIESAANQLPKHHRNFSLVITENPYAEIALLKNCETDAKIEPSFQCHLESTRQVLNSCVEFCYTNVVGERVSQKRDIQIDDDGTCPQLSSYGHFVIKQIAFQNCMPSVELLGALRLSLLKKQPSILRFENCILSSDIENALLRLLRVFRNHVNIVVFKGCSSLNALTNQFFEEFSTMEQLFVDPHSGQLLSITDATLESISRRFQSQPFHITLPRKCFTENGIREFFKAITSEDDDVLKERISMKKFTLTSNAAPKTSSLTCVLTPITLEISPSCLISTRYSPNYEKNIYVDNNHDYYVTYQYDHELNDVGGYLAPLLYVNI